MKPVISAFAATAIVRPWPRSVRHDDRHRPTSRNNVQAGNIVAVGTVHRHPAGGTGAFITGRAAEPGHQPECH